MTSTEAKHAFISYVNEDTQQVDGLCKVLEAAQIPYWRDRTALAPGDNWKAKIREAIRSGALVFIACFSDNSRSKHKSVMNEELTLAVEEFRQMAPGLTWLISVRLDDGPIPEWDLGAGRALGDLHYVSLFGDQYATEAVKLVTAVSLAMGTNGPDPATTRAAVEEAADRDRPALLRQLTKDMILNPARRIELDELIAQETKTILTAMRDEDRFPPRTSGAQTTTSASRIWLLSQPTTGNSSNLSAGPSRSPPAGPPTPPPSHRGPTRCAQSAPSPPRSRAASRYFWHCDHCRRWSRPSPQDSPAPVNLAGTTSKRSSSTPSSRTGTPAGGPRSSKRPIPGSHSETLTSSPTSSLAQPSTMRTPPQRSLSHPRRGPHHSARRVHHG